KQSSQGWNPRNADEFRSQILAAGVLVARRRLSASYPQPAGRALRSGSGAGALRSSSQAPLLHLYQLGALHSRSIARPAARRRGEVEPRALPAAVSERQLERQATGQVRVLRRDREQSERRGRNDLCNVEGARADARRLFRRHRLPAIRDRLPEESERSKAAMDTPDAAIVRRGYQPGLLDFEPVLPGLYRQHERLRDEQAPDHRG